MTRATPAQEATPQLSPARVSISIIAAAPAHAAELAQLHAVLFPDPWHGAGFAGLLGDPGARAFVARAGEPARTLGFIVGRVVFDEAEVLSLGVRPEDQRHGIATQLVTAFCRAACAEAKRLFLEVAQGNGAALGLYRRLGFREVGRRAGYYRRAGAPPEDALLLALCLAAWDPEAGRPCGPPQPPFVGAP